MARKQPFLDTQLAIEGASLLKMQGNVFAVMRICSPVVLSYLDAGFQPRCRCKDVLIGCLLL